LNEELNYSFSSLYVKDIEFLDRDNALLKISLFAAEFGHELQDMDILYYGTHYKGRLQCREPKLNPGASDQAIAKLKETLAPPPVKKFMQKPGIRCPCPALPTTPDPETVTVDPSRVNNHAMLNLCFLTSALQFVPVTQY